MLSNSNTKTRIVGNFTVGPVAPARGESFADRRQIDSSTSRERRQFGNSYVGLSDDGRQLALAIDQYKVEHHRRYLTCDEMLEVIQSLGYQK